MAAVQYTCAKVALESGHGVAGVLRGHYPRLLYPVVIGLVAANVFNAAADLAAVAEGVGLLVPVLPSLLVLPIGLGLLAFQVWGSYRRIACTFKWLTLSLLAYVGAAFLSGPD
jgi:Mn2+/Fe2+ NRAMP family transporter